MIVYNHKGSDGMVVAEMAPQSLVSTWCSHWLHILPSVFTEDLFFLSLPLGTIPSAVGWREAGAELIGSQPCHAQGHLLQAGSGEGV